MKKMIFLACPAMLFFMLGCTAVTTQRPSVLNKEVVFACNQTLLRNALADLNEQVAGQLFLDPRLNEVADLDVSYFTKNPDDSRVPLATALNILRSYIMGVHKVRVDWKVDGQKILFFYSGTDEEYKSLRKRDHE